MKWGETRLDDLIAYLQANGFDPLATAISAVVDLRTKSERTAIAKELSIGSRPDGSDDPGYAANTQQRHAVRALMLCQRVFMSALWAKVDRLPLGWKATSLGIWRDKTEAEVQAGISLYTATSAVVADVAAAAQANSENDKSLYNLGLTRASADFPISNICYSAVMSWLFLSGLVSYRWMLKHYPPSNQTDLVAAFGNGIVIWPEGNEFDAGKSLPFVPTGQIVHLFMPPNFNGHWLVSNGDGSATGCNNDEEGGAVSRIYSKSCNLDAQFRLGFAYLYYDGATAAKLAVPKKMPGKAVVIDPLLIPGRA